MSLEDDAEQQSARDEHAILKWTKDDTACHAVNTELQENSFQCALRHCEHGRLEK